MQQPEAWLRVHGLPAGGGPGLLLCGPGPVRIGAHLSWDPAEAVTRVEPGLSLGWSQGCHSGGARAVTRVEPGWPRDLRHARLAPKHGVSARVGWACQTWRLSACGLGLARAAARRPLSALSPVWSVEPGVVCGARCEARGSTWPCERWWLGALVPSTSGATWRGVLAAAPRVWCDGSSSHVPVRSVPVWSVPVPVD